MMLQGVYSMLQLQLEVHAAAVETQSYYEQACLTASGGEPRDHGEAMKSADREHWKVAEEAEMNMLFKLGVLTWVPIAAVPQAIKRISTKMVYKYKVAMPGVPPRYKCRLVAKGFMECKSEYGDSFAQVVRHETVRAFMAAAAAQDEELCSIDICSAFCTAPSR